MCVFCSEFLEGSDRMIWKDPEWVILAGRGAFVAGYCLLLPFDCYGSFSHLPAEMLGHLEPVVEMLRSKMKQAGFCEILVAEHGIGRKCGDYGSACCVDHAHLHIFPLPQGAASKVLAEYQMVGGEGLRISSPSDLSRYEKSYLYLSHSPGVHLAWDWNGSFGKQFARQMVARVIGEKQWDWRVYAFEENMKETVRILRPAF